MSSRLAGAFLALTAAALLTLSLVTSAWWAGHPEVDGRTIELKTVHVGLHGASGCNTGGDGGCTSLEMPGGFQITGYAALGIAGLLALAAILLAISTLRGAEGRTLLAKLVIGLVVVSAIAAAALILQGPKMSGSARHVAIPIGYGMFVFWGGAALAILGSVLAMRPLPKVELRPSRAAIAPDLAAPQPAKPIDVLALFHEEPARPSPAPSPGPEPMIRRAPPQAAGPLAGPAGPLGVPLFHAPALAAPPPPPPYHPPPTPPAPTPPAPPLAAPVPVAPAPLSRPITTQGVIAVPAAPPPPPRPKPLSVAPPPSPRPKPLSVPPPSSISARLKASSVPPPIRAASIPLPTAPRTIAAAVVPPPASAMLNPAFKLPVRAATDPSDHSETIDRDAMTIDHRAEPEVSGTGAEVGDSTDASITLPESEDTAANVPLEAGATKTDEVETVAAENHEPSEVVIAAAAAVPARAPSEVETKAVEKVDAVADAPVGEVAAAPKIPISTAPDSLPPPTAKQAATSGPSPACPQCESPMAWVEEHLRFYCKSCRMYF